MKDCKNEWIYNRHADIILVSLFLCSTIGISVKYCLANLFGLTFNIVYIEILLFVGFCISTSRNLWKVNKNFFVLMITFFLYITNIVLVNTVNTTSFFHDFITNCLFVLITLCYKVNYQLLIKPFVVASSSVLIMMELMLLTNHYNALDYMSFGFNFFMSFSFLLVYCYKNNIIWGIVSTLLFLPQLLVYSSRAVWYMVAILLLILLYGYSKKRWIKIVGTISIVGVLINFNWIMMLILEILSEYVPGMDYSIKNFKTMLQTKNILGSRKFLYEAAISTIKENPIIGVGIGGFEYPYPHNIFLDIWVTFGIFIGTFLIGYFIYIIINVLKINKNTEFIIFFSWGIINASRMLTSYTFVCDPMFYVVICMAINGRRVERRKNDISCNTYI